MKNRQPAWYEPRGLRFCCLPDCARCCRGEPGVVYLDEFERGAVAAHLGLTDDVFRRRWCLRVGFNRWALRERTDGDCVFLEPDGTRCQIYPVRPRQCRSYPFWSSILYCRESWEAEAAECPGINRGRLYPPAEIERLLDENS